MPDVAVEETPAAPVTVHVVPDPTLAPALDRLLLANQIRELMDDPVAVGIARVPPTDGRVARWIRRIYRATGGLGSNAQSGAEPSARAVVRDLCAVVGLRLWLRRGGVRRCVRQALGAVVRVLVSRRTRYYSRPSSTMTAYVHADSSETMVIRSCLLLRLLRRHAACIEFLIARLRSGLPAARTRAWLAFFLREIGDESAAVQVAAGASPEATQEPMALARVRTSQLKYGIVMPVMSDTPVLRGSLQSLLQSDFQGEIVIVEDGHRPQRFCEEFCSTLPVRYLKNPIWTGPSGAMDLGIRQLGSDLDVLLYVHSDVLWPRRWFAPLQEAWDEVFATGKVGLLNLPYLEFHQTTDPILSELFTQGRYEDLMWLLQTVRSCPLPLGGSRIQAITVEDSARRFGLSRDAWMDRPERLHFVTGKFSVGSSFPRESWRRLGGFTPQINYGIDLELQWHNLQQRMWTLWLNAPPLIHQASTDTGRLLGSDREVFVRMVRDSNTVFAKKYGWDYDHLFWTYFAETTVIYREAIVEAVNSLRFDDVDFVFDDVFSRMQRKRRVTCEFAWCHSYERCRYT